MGLSREDILNQEDPYLFLEEVESDESIAFAKLANEKCLNHLGDPSETDTYGRVLSVLESNDRIPHVSVMGYEEESGDMILFNFWKDSEVCHFLLFFVEIFIFTCYFFITVIFGAAIIIFWYLFIMLVYF